MGVIRRRIHQKDKHSNVGKTLMIEICARTLDKIIQSFLRNEMRRLCVPAEDPYRKIVLDFFNNSLIKNAHSFWSATKPLKFEMDARFPGKFCNTLINFTGSLTPEEMDQSRYYQTLH
jgi:hypothetical protein